MIQYPLPPLPSPTSTSPLLHSIMITNNQSTLQLDIIYKNNTNHQELINQIQILNHMQNYTGFPHIKQIHKNQNNIPISISLQKLSYSLRTLNKNCQLYNFNIPLQNIVGLSLQMLQRLEDLHHCGYLHLDLKPEHFLFQTQNPESCLYLIDFGLSINQQQINIYNSNNQLQHNKKFIGNLLYSSINRMRCLDYSIIDDLQPLIYIIGELIEGQLPWRDVFQNTSNENIIELYSKTLGLKSKKSGWKKCGEWVRGTLDAIYHQIDPYYSLRIRICQLLQFQF